MQQKVDKILKGLESGQITPEEAYSYIYENEKYKDTDKSENNKDIAIIGFACRFPDAESSDKLWLNIIKGSSAIKNIPEDRWKLDEELKKRGVKPFASMCRYGGFIDGVDLFDADFFEITEEEAVAMDPQHRLLLEAVMEGIEYSGYSREGLWGSRTGIFIGARGGDYKQGFDNNYQNARATLTGTLGNFNSARISNFFNFKGPSLVFDTACSSSLVSTHYACKSILNHECDMAVAGGVHLCINADTFISLNLMPRSLASNGVSYTFDKRADGFVPGEGVGVVILKSLTKAVEDGDTIYAVIKGSAVNNDGNTIGVTTPDLDAQQEVVEMALKAASVDAATISYIEAHGTGTMIGDPIEIRAIDKAFKKYTDNKSFCALGTVKPNIGHLDTAAGIASIIKVVLSLYNKKIPPTLNIEMPNPRINFVDSPFYPAAYLSDWSPVGGVRRAGISSFGFGGTNCHMILEEAPAQVKSTEEYEDRKEQLFLLSAKSQEALKKLAENYSVYLSKNTELKLGDICFTAGTSRTSFKNRLAVLCSNTSELSQKLGSMEVLTGDGLAAPYRVAFMFTGQGAQYSGMALELYENQPIFRAELKKCDELLRNYIGKSLIEMIYQSNGEEMKETSVTQPITFAINYALAKMWIACGVKPSAVMGHSVGEYVAACIAGIFSLEDGLKLISWRGRLMQEKCRRGAMAALMCNLEKAENLINGLNTEKQKLVSIGAKNGYLNTVISGDKDIVKELMTKAETENIRATELSVSHGFHSPMMEPMLKDYERILDEVDFHESKITIISGVTGQKADEEILGKEYWLRHVMEPVDFYSSVKSCEESNIGIMLEIGATNTLCNMAKKIVTREDLLILSTLKRGSSDWRSFQEAMSQLYLKGVSINYEAYDEGYTRKRIALPLYPFNGKKYWQNQQVVENKAFEIKPEEVPAIKPKKEYKLKEKVNHLLLDIIAGVSKPISGQLSVYNTFMSMGLDSNSLIYTGSEIEKRLDVVFYPSAFFEYNSIDAMSDFILKEYKENVLRYFNSVDNITTPSMEDVPESDTNNKEKFKHKEAKVEKCLDDDIAIIGMSGQFPKAEELNTFWNNLSQGLDCVSDIPAFRLDLDKYYDSNRNADKKTYLKKSGLLENVDMFDAEFFSISPKEAKDMDPQQRLFIQEAYHALEAGGYGGNRLYESNTGVFVGVAHTQYKEDIPYINTFTPLGNHEAIIANRVSYFMNFNGPSLVVNTQCSSSLVAIHLACRSIQNGECDQALAGGVMAVFSPIYYLSGSKLQAFSPDGSCKAFDKEANGYVPGEGCGVLLLKSLKKALEDSDNIYAVIKGSAINHGGRANNLSAPNSKAQEMVITSAMKDAGLKPDDISYIEAHGTGTVLGDPVEIRGLDAAYSKDTERKGYCAIGSLKSNIGHLESAAGVSGIIKVVLAMKHGKLPPTIHFNKLNPFIDIINSPFYINDKLKEWKCQGPKRAGISSFGMGGSNAHIIVEEYPVNKMQEERKLRKYNVITISAKNKNGLKKLAASYKNMLLENNTAEFQDVCYTTNTGRGHFEYRLAINADSVDKVITALDAFEKESVEEKELFFYGENNNKNIKVTYHFTGQVNLETCAETIEELYQSEEQYKTILDKFDSILCKKGINFLQLIKQKDLFKKQVNEDEKIKVITGFFFEYSLGKMLEHAGLTPISMEYTDKGVYAVACLTGYMEVEKAIELILKGVTEEDDYFKEIKESLDGDSDQQADYKLYLGYKSTEQINVEKSLLPINSFINKDCNLFTFIISKLYSLGVDLEWSGIYRQYSTGKVELPLYPFSRDSFWKQSSMIAPAPAVKEVYEISLISGDYQHSTYNIKLNAVLEKLMNEHKVLNNRIMPGTGYIDIAMFVMQKFTGTVPAKIQNVTVLNTITYEQFNSGEVKIECKKNSDEGLFTIFRSNSETTGEKQIECVTGRVSFEKQASQNIDKNNFNLIDGNTIDSIDIYEAYKAIGMNYGKSFMCIDSIRINGKQFVSSLSLKEHSELEYFYVHQGMLDGALQSIIAASMNNGVDNSTAYLPFYYENILIYEKLNASKYVCHGEIKEDISKAASNIKCDIDIYDTYGKKVISIEGFTVKKKQLTLQNGKNVNVSSEVMNYLNEVRWINVNLNNSDIKMDKSGKWLIFSGNNRFTNILKEKLADYGQEAVIISEVKDIEQEISSIKDMHSSIRGIIYSTAYDDAKAKINSIECFHREEGAALRNLFYLAKSLGNTNRRQKLEFITLTGDAVYIEGKKAEINPTNASVWAFSKVMDIENESLNVRCIDFDCGQLSEEDNSESIAREICLGADKYVLYNGGKRYISEIYQLKSEVAQTPSKFLEQGVYVITGGLGEIALETSKYLAEKYNAKLILLSRTALPDKKDWNSIIENQNENHKDYKRIKAIEALDSEVEVLQCDITNEAQLRDCIDSIRRKYGKINGIFHMAGIIKDKLISLKTWDDMVEVLAPKVIGAELLDKVTENDNLDFFAMYSSVAAITGNMGQSDYAAGNSYIDALAYRRRASGKTAVSLNWTLWEQIGMGVKFINAQKSRGVKTIKNAAAMEAMEYSLTRVNGQVIIADLSQYITSQKANDGKDYKQEAEDYFINKIADFLCAALDYNKESIDITTSFVELGIDSILGVEIIRKIEDLLDTPLNPTFIYDYPNIERLSNFLAANYLDEIIDKGLVACSGSSVENERTFIDEIAAETLITDTAEEEFEETDIAVIGMSYRLPGTDEENDFLDFLTKGESAINEFPSDRALTKVQKEDNNKPLGGYLEDIYSFDPQFFNITPKEAELMDPQQRTMLKVVWEAVEVSGYSDKIQGSDTGVFIGVSTNEYQLLVGEHHSQVGTGNALSITANRISYFFDLKGPSMAIDTACSSSLVSLDMACANIRQGNCDMAIAGGVSLILTTNTTKVFNEAGMLSAEGRCKTFDSSANGYVRGEGCGVVVLKPMKKAKEDKDNILAVIKGSSVNQDGHTNGLTAPNAISQELVIKKALKLSKVNAENITYIEAHGTGTPLGDPIEIRALTSVFNSFTDRKSFCAIGSVKTNIGHLEAASGIASIIKVILALKYKVILPTLNFKKLNAHIPLIDSPFYIADEVKPWKCENGKRIAGVSSFGFGGTNSHAVIQEAPSITMASDASEKHCIFTVSATNQLSLRNNIKRLCAYIKKNKEINLASISYTLTARRKHFSNRIVFIAQNRDEVIRKLEYILSQENFKADNEYGYSIIKSNYAVRSSKVWGQKLEENLTVDERISVLKELEKAYLLDEKIQWYKIFAEDERRVSELPPYCFNEDRYIAGEENSEKAEESLVKTENPDNSKTIKVYSYSTEGLADKISSIFVEQLIEKLKFKADQIDIDSSLMDYGFDSVFAVSALQVYEQKIGTQLDPTLLFDFSSIRDFSKYLAEEYNEQFQTYFAGAEESEPAVEQYISPIINTTEDTLKSETTPLNSINKNSSDIAIIGYSGRFPKCDSPEMLWDKLKEGFDGISQLPEERYVYGGAEKNDTLKDVFSGYIGNVHMFDPLLFNISGKEAECMDPQQRLMLEVVWETLEHSGYNSQELADRKTGVFVGTSSKDYSVLISEGKSFSPYMGTGNAPSIIANRISHTFNLKGPSISVDTACSSSLVAIHLACQSIYSGESNIAIAGGVNLLLDYDSQAIFEKAGMLSADHHCKTFDDSANGYVRAECAGAIMLKPLEAALRDGDHIHAVIKATGVNQDGRSNGLTVPNAVSQTELLCETWNKGGINPETISYIEAHGTATSLGDPIEIRGITEAFKKYTNKKSFCAVGSIKSNIGHAESAAGIAGIIKVILAMKHGYIPPSVNFKRASKKINFIESPVYVNAALNKWESIDGVPKRAGISSFGFGGTNSHILLEEAPKISADVCKEPDSALSLLTLSGKNQSMLKKYLGDIYSHIKKNNDLNIYDLCYTLSTGRQHMNNRLAVKCNSRDELLNKLESVIESDFSNNIQGVWKSENSDKKHQPVVFMYTGQGSQYKGAGYTLYLNEPIFREALEKCEELLLPYIKYKLTDLLYSDKCSEELLNQTNIAQPVIFSFGYALTCLWMEWGIRPDIVLGHSVGEYIAAVVAGVFSLQDGIKLIAERGRLMSEVAAEGEMYAVFANLEVIKAYIKDYPSDKIRIAAINSPNNIVVSGDKEIARQVIKKLSENNINSQKLAVSNAFHSPLMEPIVNEFRALASKIQYFKPAIPIVSNVSADIFKDKTFNPEYLVEHLLNPVKFMDSIELLEEQGYKVFVEISGRQTLVNLCKNIFKDKKDKILLSSLQPSKNYFDTVTDVLGQLYALGSKINWCKIYANKKGRKIPLPAYPFNRKSYWFKELQDSHMSSKTGRTSSMRGKKVQ